MEVGPRILPLAAFAAGFGMRNDGSLPRGDVDAAFAAAHVPAVGEPRDGGPGEVANRLVAGADLNEAAVGNPHSDVLHDFAAKRVRHQRLRQFVLVVQQHLEFARLPLGLREVESAHLLPAGAVREEPPGVGDTDFVQTQFVGKRAEEAARRVRIAPPRLLPHFENAVAHFRRQPKHAPVDALPDVDGDVFENVVHETSHLVLRHAFVQRPGERHRRRERDRDRAHKSPGEAAATVRGRHRDLLSPMTASSAARSAASPLRTAMPKFSRVCSGEATIAPRESFATRRTVQLS